MGEGAVAEEIWVVRGDAGVREFGIVGIGEGHVAAERKGAEGEFNVRGGGEEAGERRTEANGEFGDADFEEGGGEEMTGFVDEDYGGEDRGGLRDGLEGGEIAGGELGREAAAGGEGEGFGEGEMRGEVGGEERGGVGGEMEHGFRV